MTGLTGCALPGSGESRLNLAIFNQTETPYTVDMNFFDPAMESSRSEVKLNDASISIEPEGKAMNEGIVETQSLLVRFTVFENDSSVTERDHIHYYPSDDERALTFNIRSPGVLIRR